VSSVIQLGERMWSPVHEPGVEAKGGGWRGTRSSFAQPSLARRKGTERERKRRRGKLFPTVTEIVDPHDTEIGTLDGQRNDRSIQQSSSPATRVAPRLLEVLGRADMTLCYATSRRVTHLTTAAVRLGQESMATLATRPRLLALRRPQRRRLRACAAAPCARRAPVPPQAARPRRVFLGLGAAVIDQVARMASGGTSSRSFVAGARPRQGVSPVEQVFRRCHFLLCLTVSFSKILLCCWIKFGFRSWLMGIYCRFWRMWSGLMSSLSSLRTSAASTSKIQPFSAFSQFMCRVVLDRERLLGAGSRPCCCHH
jgi:hypothetical protein